jgi:hypothetical protein
MSVVANVGSYFGFSRTAVGDRTGALRCALCRRATVLQPGGLCVRCKERAETWDWKQLCRHEPELKMLLAVAEMLQSTPRHQVFCANRVWLHVFRPRVCQLVGSSAKDPALRSSHCYDVAHRKIYFALPDCRGCKCLEV